MLVGMEGINPRFVVEGRGGQRLFHPGKNIVTELFIKEVKECGSVIKTVLSVA